MKKLNQENYYYYYYLVKEYKEYMAVVTIVESELNELLAVIT